MEKNAESIALDQIGLAAPAVRALHGAGYTQLEQLTNASERELAALHGMGPNALKKLRDVLAAHGLSFKGGNQG